MATETPASQLDTAQPRTLEEPPKEPPAKRIRRALAEGDPALAERLAEQALSEAAGSPILRRLWIQATNAQGKREAALERAREAIERHPADPALHQLHAQLLANAGETEQALAYLAQALTVKPDHIGLQLLQIKLLPKAGQLGQSLDGLRRLRHQQFDNLTVLLAAARFYQGRGRTQAALAVVERMLSIEPGHQKALPLKRQLTQSMAIKRVRRAQAEGDSALAERLAEQALADGVTSPILQRLWIQATNQQGKLETALERAREAVQRHPPHAHPNNPSLHQQYAQLLSNAGETSQALACLEQALAATPERLGLLLLLFKLQQQSGQTRQALDSLRRLRRHHADNPDVLLAVARFYQGHGRMRAALAVAERLLALDPDHRQARLLRLSLLQEAAVERGDASPLPALLDAARVKPALSDVEAAELLQAVKLTTAAALAPACREALAYLQPLTERLSEGEQLGLLMQADRLDQHETARRALNAILAQGPKHPTVARGLFNKAMESLDIAQAPALAERLLRHIPVHQQAALQAQFIQHAEGAEAALDFHLATPRQRRTLPQARELAGLLRNARHYRLGLRYLRLCRRRWPDDAGLPVLHARLAMDAGYPEMALAILDTPLPVAQRLQGLRLRIEVLLETGDLDETRAALETVHGRLHGNGLLDTYLRVLMLQGQEDAAAELLQEAQRRGQHKRLASGHLTPTVVGNLMADLSLLGRERRALPTGHHDAALAMRYINAASPVIRRHVQHRPALDGASPIPRHIFQYWDAPTPPQAVTEIMASWCDLPGFGYRRFNKAEASAFLHEHFGADFARAFRLAGNVAESADLLRLCYLRHHGGLYVDADDRLSGRLEALLPHDADLVCFREPFDILGNNVIACVPGHPAITLASELAVEAILGRDSETTWSKTGPGLLTRAVAHHLLRGDVSAPGQRVAILPAYLLRREIQIHIPLPHKKTRGYWNATGPTGQFDMAALINANP
uniref:tetratricopeptide repeat protein n=1 Tax=uncultured Halomonas sp. TaxID=173971 RepID=UPI00262986C7|nr:tetratricopeptide repeat protein [uncultured Halomonas sp.]